MGAWHFLVLSAGKPHAHKIPRFREGVWKGVVEVPILFYGHGDFSELPAGREKNYINTIFRSDLHS